MTASERLLQKALVGSGIGSGEWNFIQAQTWRDAKRRDGTTHLAHFLPDPTRSDNIPMTVGDVELLPSVWREPDRVRKLRKDLFEAQLDTIDGHTIVAQIKMLDTKNGYMPQLWTLYKKIAGSGSKSGGRL